MFESTLNPETRRSGGMHYTSIENDKAVISAYGWEKDITEEDIFVNLMHMYAKKVQYSK